MNAAAGKGLGRPRNPTRAIAGFVVGAALLAAAVWAAYSQEHTLLEGLRAAREARWWLVGLALGLPLVNLLVVSVGFWLLNNRHGRVRLDEMIALIASAWLFNFLPMRPGMFGRIAYHKRYNGIPLKASARVLIESLVLGAAGLAWLVVVTLTLGAASVTFAWAWISAAALPVAAGLVAWGILRHGTARMYAGAFAMKYADMLLWAVRYWAVFAMIGRPIGPREAVAVAVVSQVALLVPLAGNGLGLREWAVGLLTAALPAWFALDDGDAAGTGLTADLVNRAAEIAVAVPVGLLASGAVAAYARRHGRRSAGPDPE